MLYDLKWAQEKNGICEGDNASFVCETETGILQWALKQKLLCEF